MPQIPTQLLSQGLLPDLPSDPLLLVATGITIGLIVLCIWLILTTINACIGLRQKREGNGSWGRLLLVAGAIATMQAAPAGLGLLIWGCTRHAHDYDALFAATIFVTLPTIFVLWTAMGPTVRFRHSREPLPLVEDEGLPSRVAELSGKLGIRTPVVRLLPTGGGELHALAFAGGLVSPSLVVGDGILHRLSAEERDATLAHELAHIANHSLWWLTLAVPLGAVGAVLISTTVSLSVAVAFGFTLFVGLRNLTSRHFEYDCDRRAAHVIGFRTTASALAKIHAANPIRDLGWLSYLVFATATHPSRTERLSAVRQAAPADDCPPRNWPEDEVRRRRIAGRVATGIWLLSLVVIPSWARMVPDSGWPVVVLWMIGGTPWLAMILASLLATRDQRRRMVEKGRMKKWLAVLATGAFVGWVFATDRFTVLAGGFNDSESRAVRLLMLLGIVMGSVFLLIFCVRTLRRGIGSRVLHQVMLAMQMRDFDRVFELAQQSPKPFKKSAALRHNLGFACVIAGQRERGIEILESLLRDEPGYVESALVLAMTHLDEGRFAEAFSLVEDAQEKLPKDPTPVMLRGLCLRHLGRLDEARQCVDRALELKPESGNIYAVAALIALDQGQFDQADSLLAQGEEYDPATAVIEFVKAEVALAKDDADAVRQQIRRAIQASDANPYALLQIQVLQLSRRIMGE